MQKVQMLQHSGVTPVVVFDGGRLPMKAAEEGTRHRFANGCECALAVSLYHVAAIRIIAPAGCWCFADMS